MIRVEQITKQYGARSCSWTQAQPPIAARARRWVRSCSAPSGFSAESVIFCTSTRHPGQPMASEQAWNGSQRSLDPAHAIVRGYKDAGPRPSHQHPAAVSV